MLIAEAALLRATRNYLRSQLALTAEECDIEFDGEVPAVAREWYYAIVPGGITLGPRHQSSGGVWDYKIAARVVLYRRIAGVARDRRSDILIDLQTEVASKLDEVIDKLDYSYPLLDAAALLLPGTLSEDGEFPEPFREVRPDLSTEMIYRDPYTAAQMESKMGDPVLGVRRGVTFSGARFMKVR